MLLRKTVVGTMKHEQYRKARHHILAGMIVVPLVPFLISLAVGYYSYSATIEEMAFSSLRQQSQYHARKIGDFLHECRSDLDLALALAPMETLRSQQGLMELFHDLQSSTSAFIDIGVIDGSGRQVAYFGPYELEDREYADALWYVNARRTMSYISDVYLGFRNEPHVTLAVARERMGETWVMRATLNPLALSSLVDSAALGGEAYIVNRKGVPQISRLSNGAILEPDGLEYPEPAASTHTFRLSDRENDYIYAASPLNDGRWRLMVRQEEHEAYAPIQRASVLIVIIMLIGGGAIVGLAVYISGRIAASLRSKDEAVSGLENQLFRAARLAELGEMSAGFAHEINNPLQVMKSDLALMEFVAGDIAEKTKGRCDGEIAELREIVEQLMLQIRRCAGITRKILKFGRYGEPVLERIDLVEYLPGVGGLVEKKAAVHGIAMHCDVAPDTPAVKADPGQLQQVMLNLLNNAIHALVDQHGSRGGILDVKAVRDEQGRARITVADNGTGIPRDNLERIFNPFYTTKAPGKGTGLGLSVCYGIITSLGGEISVQSETGKGTTFVIVLPATD